MLQWVEPTLGPRKPADLDNDLHPVFHAANFSVDFDLQLIEMPLRLASHLLQSPALIPLINTLACGVVKSLDGIPTTWPAVYLADRLAKVQGEQNAQVCISASLNGDQISNENKEYAQYILGEFANMVRFEVVEYPAGGGTSGETEVVNDPLTWQSRLIFPHGWKSVIHISKRSLDRLTRFTKDPAGEDSLCCCRAALAITIVHELAHALRNATCGIRLPEPIYESDAFSELGF